MKDSCSSVSKILEKYFDHEVTDEERALVEGHLTDCLACQDALRSMEELRHLVRAPVEEAVGKEDFQWVWQKIKRGIQPKERPTWWETLQSWLDLSPLFRKRILIPAVAAIAIFILVTAPILFKKSPSPQDVTVVEYVESSTHNVMVYESEQERVTVIWLFEGPEEEAPTI